MTAFWRDALATYKSFFCQKIIPYATLLLLQINLGGTMKNTWIILALLLSTHLHCLADDHLELLISQEEIAERISETAARIDQDYEGQTVTLIMIMKGAICVTSDLIRKLHVPCTLQAITASSYGQNGVKSGTLTLSGLERLTLEGQNVIVIDDIFDTGKTMGSVMAAVQQKNPKSVKSMVLLLKSVPHVSSYVPEYSLFEITNRFVVGYGLDYKEFYRGLPGIYAFINDAPPADS